MYIREVLDEIYQLTGTHLSASLLCNFLKTSGFTRQKMERFAIQRSDELRFKFESDVSLYEHHMLVFIDEVGTDQRNTLRKYGYSLCGRTPHSCDLLVRGERISIIAIMTNSGVKDLYVVRGGVDGDAFLDFIDKCLLLCLMPFNGTNPNSVVILDNCSIHHAAQVSRVVQEVGTVLHYLPPYSPDFNPIELSFAKVKALLPSLEKVMPTVKDIETLAFTAITEDDCNNWINECGIYN